MAKRMRLTFFRRGRRPSQTLQHARDAERASGEEAMLTRERQDAESTPSAMTRLKTDRL